MTTATTTECVNPEDDWTRAIYGSRWNLGSIVKYGDDQLWRAWALLALLVQQGEERRH